MARNSLEDSFGLNDEMLESLSGILDKLPAIFTSLKGSESTVRAIGRIVKNICDDTGTATSKAEKTSSKLAKAATTIYRNFRLNDLVSQAGKLGDVFISTAKQIQQRTSATFSEWTKFYKQVVSATKDLNREIGKAAINSAELLAAANKLASIGFKDIGDSLTQVSSSLAMITKSVGTVTDGLNKSVISLQKVFKDGTAALVEGLGDTLVAYNSVFGVTTEKLQESYSFLTSSLIRISKGNERVMRDVTSDLFKAVSLAESLGIDAQSISNVLSDAMNMSYGKFAGQYAQSLSLMGINAQQFQKMVQQGNMSDAVQMLITSIQGRFSSLDTNTQNLYKELMSGMGLDSNTINSIINNEANTEDIIKALKEIQVTEGGMANALGNRVMTLGERFENFLSGSKFIGSLQNGLAALGIGSVKDATLGISSALAIKEALGDMDIGEGLAKKLTSLGGKEVDKDSSLLDGIKSIFSGDEGGFSFKQFAKILGKAAIVIGIAMAAMAILQKVIDKLRNNAGFQEALKALKEAVGAILDFIMEIFDGIADVLAEVITKIVEVLGKLFEALKPVFKIIVDIVKQLLPVVKKIFDTLISIIDMLIDPLVALITIIVNIIQEVLSKVIPIVNALLEAITKVISIVLDVIGAIIKVIGSVLNIIVSIVNEIVGIITKVLEGLMPVIDAILEVIAAVMDALVPILQAVMELIDTIFAALEPVIDVIIEMVKQILAPLANTLQQIFKILGPLLKPIVILIKAIAKVVQMLAPIINFITGIVKAVFGAFQAIGNWLASISIFGWHPFGFLKSDSGGSDAPEVPEVSNDSIINNESTQEQFNSTQAAGGLTYGFGLTGQGFHAGTDIPMSSGTPLTAAQAGVVTSAGYTNTYGNYASILGSDGIQRVFGHLSSVGVGRGETILPGQQIGESGNSGDSAMPHLHYETRESGSFVDPYIIAQRGGNNADVVKAIAVMTERLEKKLEEVSQQTEDNSQWIKDFDAAHRAKPSGGY